MFGGVVGMGVMHCGPNQEAQQPPPPALGDDGSQQQLDRALAVVSLARTCTDGGAAARGTTFTTVEALALHVKALDLMQRCMVAQQQQPFPAVHQQHLPQAQLMIAGPAAESTWTAPQFEVTPRPNPHACRLVSPRGCGCRR